MNLGDAQKDGQRAHGGVGSRQPQQVHRSAGARGGRRRLGSRGRDGTGCATRVEAARVSKQRCDAEDSTSTLRRSYAAVATPNAGLSVAQSVISAGAEEGRFGFSNDSVRILV